MEFNIWAFVTPIALGLLIFEIILSVATQKGYYTFQETIANLGTAIGNQTVNLLVAVFVFWSFGLLYENYAMTEIPVTWWSAALLLVLIDFLFYWFHRVGHRVNLFWAAHMPHHSAEEMNIAVGLRASVTQRLFSFAFFWPLPLLGFDPFFMYTMVGVHLFMSLWHHTKVIKSLGWFEVWFNTPSHHRVHHGMNKQYIDKNFGEFLIIWDKMFGTFEPEVEEPCYGVLYPPKSWNPLVINFQHYIYLIKSSWNAPYFWDKIKIWFMPPSWRPRGMREGELLDGMTNEQFTRYHSKMFPNCKPYLIAQIVFGMAFMVFVIDGKSPLSAYEKIFGSGLIWMMVVAWGGILESKRWAPLLEITRLALMAGLVVYGFEKYNLTAVALEYAAIAAAALSSLWVLVFFRDSEDQSMAIPTAAK